MQLKGIDFGCVLNSSGARGFFGEGYWFHRPWKRFGLDYSGSTFVAKTTTLKERAGNMPLRQKAGLWSPIEIMPKCIIVKPLKKVVLNSVGLSGPGIEQLLYGWKKLDKEKPLMISIMSVEQDAESRLSEITKICSILKAAKNILPQATAVQVNLSCPNAGINPDELAKEALESVRTASMIGLPILAKVNALFPINVAATLCSDDACDGLVVSNTIPWGKMADQIDWKGLFGSDISPLAHIGGGGLSGEPLLPIVCSWIRTARVSGISKPIVGGGGILSLEDASRVLQSGADAIELGSISILRPWRIQGIIQFVTGARS